MHHVWHRYGVYTPFACSEPGYGCKWHRALTLRAEVAGAVRIDASQMSYLEVGRIMQVSDRPRT